MPDYSVETNEGDVSFTTDRELNPEQITQTTRLILDKQKIVNPLPVESVGRSVLNALNATPRINITPSKVNTYSPSTQRLIGVAQGAVDTATGFFSLGNALITGATGGLGEIAPAIKPILSKAVGLGFGAMAAKEGATQLGEVTGTPKDQIIPYEQALKTTGGVMGLGLAGLMGKHAAEPFTGVQMADIKETPVGKLNRVPFESKPATGAQPSVSKDIQQIKAEKISPIYPGQKDVKQTSIQARPLNFTSNSRPLNFTSNSSVGRALKDVVEKKLGTEGQQMLAKVLNEKYGHVLDFARINEQEGENSHYDPSTHSVKLGKGDNLGQISSLNHEAAHAATYHALENDKEFKEDVEGLRKTVIKNLPKGVQGFFNAVYSKNINKGGERTSFDEIDNWFKAHDLGASKWHEILYALADPHEYVASFFHSKQFRTYLDTIPYEQEPGKTIFDKFYDFIRSVLRIKAKSVADKTLQTILEGGQKAKREYLPKEVNGNGEVSPSSLSDTLKRILSSQVDVFDLKTPQGFNDKNEAIIKGKPTKKTQENLSKLTKGKPLYHETSLKNAVEIYQRLKKEYNLSWSRFITSDNIDLALGQGQKGVIFELDPARVNGYIYYKPGTFEATGREYTIDKSIYGAAKALIFETKIQLDAFKKKFPNSLDYEQAKDVERGIRVPVKNKLKEQTEEKNDIDKYTDLQKQMTELMNKDPFDPAIENIMGQMEEIKNKNQGYVPGTEPEGNKDTGIKYAPDLPSNKEDEDITKNLDWVEKNLYPNAKGDRKFKATVKATFNRVTGVVLPNTMAVSRKAADAIVEYVQARMINDATKAINIPIILGDLKEEEQNLIGSAIKQNQQDGLREGFYEEGERERAKEVTDVWESPDSPIKSRAQYEELHNNARVIEAVERVKRYASDIATERHENVGGELVNLGDWGVYTRSLNLVKEGEEEIGGSRQSRRGQLLNALKQQSEVNKRRWGTGKNYEFNLEKIVQATLDSNVEESAKRNMYKVIEKENLGVRGQKPDKLGGLDTHSIKTNLRLRNVEPKGEPEAAWNENLWLREDIFNEVRQALQTESPIGKGIKYAIISTLNDVQLAGVVDMVNHNVGVFSDLASSQGKHENVILDFLSKLPGISALDTIVRLSVEVNQAIANTPEFKEHWLKLAKAGTSRTYEFLPSKLHDMVGKVPIVGKSALKFLTFNHTIITTIDKAARVVLSKNFDRLVKRGWIKDTPSERREFTAKIGVYERRLMPRWEAFMRESGISPFIVAGKRRNISALQVLSGGLLDAHMTAKGKLIEGATTIATLAVIPFAINYYMVGNIWGRPGVSPGDIDTGRTSKDGKPIVIQTGKLLRLQRGKNLTAVNEGFRGLNLGERMDKYSHTMLKEMAYGVASPLIGPAVRAEEVLRTGHDIQGKQIAENPNSLGSTVLAALKYANPMIARYFETKEQGGGVKGGTGKFLGQTLGVVEGRQPSIVEQELREFGDRVPTLKEQSKFQKKNQDTQTKRMLTPQQELMSRQAVSAQEVETKQELVHALPSSTQSWLEGQNLKVPGFAAYLKQTGVNTYLLPRQKEEYMKIMVNEYSKEFNDSRVRGVIEKQTTQEGKQRVFDVFIKVAHGRARNAIRKWEG